jgi:transcriptional regulator with XRE-family HTH domain
MDESSIAKNIKTLRLSKKISLQELSKLTGLTRGYLSKVERARKAPPFSTLNKVALTLGVDVTSLLKENAEELMDTKISVARKGKGKKVTTKGTLYGYEYEALAYNKPGKNMQPFIIEPASEQEVVFQHEGEELMYTLEGTHEFTYDGKKYILREGDSVYFDSTVPHSGRGIGRKKTKILAIMYSYRR